MQKLNLLAGSFLTALFLFPAFSSAQTISIVSGNGQLVCPDCQGGPFAYQPLVVQVNDSTGAPAANTVVTWTASQSGYSPVTGTSTTNSAGQATCNPASQPSTCAFAPFGFFFGSNILPATVLASALGESVTFVETTAEPILSGPGQGTTNIAVVLVPPGSGPKLSGISGQTSSTPITINVGSPYYGPLPNVQLRLQSNTANGPTVTCATQAGQQPGTVLTDKNGNATCNPVFGGIAGTGTYTIWVGDNYNYFGPDSLTVTTGPPAIMKIISGNNQSVNSNTKAPLALTAEVTDVGGSALPNIAVKWAVTEGTATLSNVVNTTINVKGAALGQVSAAVTPITGPVQVTVSVSSNPAVNAVFTINVNQVITGLSIVSGSPQETAEGTAFTAPLLVQVNDNSAPVAGVPVTFLVSTGTVSLSSSSATTNAQGQAQVTATAGSSTGTAVVTASVKSGSTTYSQSFELTIVSPGATVSSVVNSAGFQSEFLSPCSLATIYGTGLAPGLQGVASAFIEPSTTVAGVSVQFGGVFAPILDVANVNGTQSVSVQVPCEVPASTTTPATTTPMVITVNGVVSSPYNVTVLTLSPGIFQFVDTDGATRAVLVKQDGSYVTIANPAHPGDIIRMFVTGLGQTTPALFSNENDPLVVDTNGDLVPQELTVNASIVVGVNNGGVLVKSARYAYFGVGVYEVDFQVPDNTPVGNNAPFAIAVYEGTKLIYGNGSLIPIQ